MSRTPFKDLYELPEDERIKQIGETAMAGKRIGVALEHDEPEKIERYIRKITEQFPDVTCISRVQIMPLVDLISFARRRWETPPWRESEHTQIWDIEERGRALLPAKTDLASLATWLVHAPWMHTAWNWHYASLIHLRPIVGQTKEPTITVPGATHEFLVFALNPDEPINPDKLPIEGFAFLTPVSIVQQFIADSDAAALAHVEKCLELTLPGRVTLDSDGRAMWHHLLLEHREKGRHE